MNRIIAIDIDGVLNDYPKTWVDYANGELYTEYENLSQLKQGVSYTDYNALKRKYRTSRIKETFEPKEGAKELLNFLKSKGYFIVIMTSRPIEEYNELLFQTINWLRKNGLEYDFLYFSKRKHLDIIEKFNNLSFMIEDNRAYANAVSNHGYRVFLVDNEYNKGETNNGVIRVHNLSEISEYISKEE